MSDIEPTGGRTHAERVATFLQFACWDQHVYGKGDHRMHDRAAARLLAQHPAIARDSLYTAIVCGDLDEVERRFSERPEAALEAGGARGWTPILYLCFTRFTHASTIEHAVAIGRALLDRGANPNDFYMAGHARYSALVGVAGEGEQDAPRQPQSEALFELLLERGAEPFDMQVLYNTHFTGDVLWWLELIHAHTKDTPRAAAWHDPEWMMLGMGGYGSGARFLLWTALKKRNIGIAEWVLAHGASPDPGPPRAATLPQESMHAEALRADFPEMAALLARYGAPTVAPVLTDEERFIRACLRLDRDEARVHLDAHPELLHSPRAIFAAAQRDRADAVAFLLDLGVPIEIADEHAQRPLHIAAMHNALHVARLLIERGAEIDPCETQWGATPIGAAAYGDVHAMVDFLSAHSRNVWTLAFRGAVDRLRVVLAEDASLAKLVTGEGITPLWWLPDDEEKALQIVDLLLAGGADPAVKSKQGGTAASWALKRGMWEVAARLAAAAPSAAAER